MSAERRQGQAEGVEFINIAALRDTRETERIEGRILGGKGEERVRANTSPVL
jgi:hypothetical protein